MVLQSHKLRGELQRRQLYADSGEAHGYCRSSHTLPPGTLDGHTGASR